jgi:hypothetical protein
MPPQLRSNERLSWHRRFDVLARFPVRWLMSTCLVAMAASASGQPAAIVIDVRGMAQVEEKPARLIVQVLDVLPAGTRLTIAKSSRVDFLYLDSGAQFAAAGPSLVEIGPVAVAGIIGTMPVRQPVAPGSEVRLRRDRVVQGGIVLRSLDGPAGATNPVPAPAELARRRPPTHASFARRVAHALWLEETGAASDAREAWRRLSQERPSEEGIAKRSQ